MKWCEDNALYYCMGFARNATVSSLLAPLFAQLKAQIEQGSVQMPCREFIEFGYRTQRTWSCFRRMIGKAEILSKGQNPRFIVTNLPEEGFAQDNDKQRLEPAALYQQFYCAGGDMENRIKEQQLDLFADRTSTHWKKSNQLRLWFSAFAHLMLSRLQADVLKGTQWAKASLGQIRLKLFKIAARVKVSVRRIHFELASAYPYREDFLKAHANLQ